MNSSQWVDLSNHFSNQNIKAIFSFKSFSTEGDLGRKSLAIASGFNPNSLIIPKQTHSTNIKFISGSGTVLDTDGIFSTNPEMVCSIQVADCMPVYFSHKSESIFGLVHVGWRGLVNGILAQSAKRIKEKDFSLLDYDILIGPSIQKCCFEVSDDVVDQFESGFVEEKEAGKYQIDLQKMVIFELTKLGFMKQNILSLNECTYCNSEKYHSYRRNGKKAGRMIGLLGYNLNSFSYILTPLSKF